MKKLLPILLLIFNFRNASAQDYILKNMLDRLSISKDGQGINIIGNDIKDNLGNYFLKSNGTHLSNDSLVVHLDGAETITGAKTFLSAIILKNGLNFNDIYSGINYVSGWSGLGAIGSSVFVSTGSYSSFAVGLNGISNAHFLTATSFTKVKNGFLVSDDFSGMPSVNAGIQLISTTKGIQTSDMTAAQRNAIGLEPYDANTGMLIYQKDAGDKGSGLYTVLTGSVWDRLLTTKDLTNGVIPTAPSAVLNQNATAQVANAYISGSYKAVDVNGYVSTVSGGYLNLTGSGGYSANLSPTALSIGSNGFGNMWVGNDGSGVPGFSVYPTPAASPNPYIRYGYNNIFRNNGNYTMTINYPELTANRGIDFPDKSGTVALISDIPASSGLSPVLNQTNTVQVASANISGSYMAVDLGGYTSALSGSNLNFTGGGSTATLLSTTLSMGSNSFGYTFMGNDGSGVPGFSVYPTPAASPSPNIRYGYNNIFRNSGSHILRINYPEITTNRNIDIPNKSGIVILSDIYGNIVTENKIMTADGKDIFKTPNGSWKWIHVDDDGSRLVDNANVTIDSEGNATVSIKY